MSKIVHICYPGIGGQAAVATGLAQQGMLAGEPQGIVFYGVEETDAQYIQLCNDAGIDHVTIVKRPGIGFGARKELRTAIQAMGAQVVIAHHHDTCLSAAFRSQPQVIYVEHHSNALKTKKDWILSALAHRMSNHTVYLTEVYRDTVQKKLGRWMNPQKTSVISNGLNLDLYNSHSQDGGNGFVIGMQGRMNEGKDFATLLRAFAEMSHEGVRLELAGDGPDRKQLEELAADLGISSHVTFFGFLPHAELVRHMQGWSMAVLATMGETLSVAILEAWALQIPLVCSDVPGVGDLISDGNDGLLVAPLSAEALSAGMQKLIENHDLRKDIAQAGRCRVEKHFNRKMSWSLYSEVITELLPTAGKASSCCPLNPLSS